MAFQLEIVAETGSTNADIAARLRANEGLPEGYWLCAERQTGGKGREGRAWQSHSGNLHASTLVLLLPDDPPAHTLSFVAGLAVWRLLKARLPLGAAVTLKWPNDVLVDGAKISGILLEKAGDAVVIGFGINVAVAPDVSGRRTTCLRDENGHAGNDVIEVLHNLSRALEDELSKWREQGLASILADWCDAAHPLDTPMTVRVHSDQQLSGTFAGLDADGGLRLRLPDGSTRAIHAGDVTLETN